MLEAWDVMLAGSGLQGSSGWPWHRNFSRKLHVPAQAAPQNENDVESGDKRLCELGTESQLGAGVHFVVVSLVNGGSGFYAIADDCGRGWGRVPTRLPIRG